MSLAQRLRFKPSDIETQREFLALRASVQDELTSGVSATARANTFTGGGVCLLGAHAAFTSGVTTAITWQDIITGYDAAWWSAGAPTKLKVPVGYGGYYMITYSLCWSLNTTGQRGTYLTKNGATTSFIEGTPGPTSGICTQTGGRLLRLVDGDELVLSGNQNTGGNLAPQFFGGAPNLSVGRVSDL